MTSRGLTLYALFDSSAQSLLLWYILRISPEIWRGASGIEKAGSVMRWEKKIDGQNKSSSCGRRANERAKVTRTGHSPPSPSTSTYSVPTPQVAIRITAPRIQESPLARKSLALKLIEFHRFLNTLTHKRGSQKLKVSFHQFF